MPKSELFSNDAPEEEVVDATAADDTPEPEHTVDPDPVVADADDEVKVRSDEVAQVSVAGFPDVEIGPKGTLVSAKHAEALALSVPSVEVVA